MSLLSRYLVAIQLFDVTFRLWLFHVSLLSLCVIMLHACRSLCLCGRPSDRVPD